MLTALDLIPFKNAARRHPLVVGLDQVDLATDKAIDRVVSPNLAERRVDTAFALLECAVALAEMHAKITSDVPNLRRQSCEAR